jgi:hypothetical protein
MRKRTRKRKSAPVDNGVWTSLSPEEEEKKIIEMLDAHVPQAEIARIFKRNINFITEKNKKRQQSLKLRVKSSASQAFKLFKEDKNVLDVAIELGIDAPEEEDYLAQYWRLRALDDFYAVYKDLGPRLGEFIAAFKEMSSKGITVDQAIEIRNLSSKVHELRSHYSSLTNENARLSTEIPQMREQRVDLTNQLANLNSELNNRMAINKQLKHEYDDLNSILKNTKQRDPTFQKIKQIVKEEGRSIMSSRQEQILTSLISVVTVLKNDSKLVTLLIAPGPGLGDPRLRAEVVALVNNTWDEISSTVEKQVMEKIFDIAKGAVDDLHRTGS